MEKGEQATNSRWYTYEGEGFSIQYPDKDLFSSSKQGGKEILTYFALLNNQKEKYIELQITKQKTDKNDIHEWGKDYPMYVLDKIGEQDTLSSQDTTYCSEYFLIHNGYLYTVRSLYIVVDVPVKGSRACPENHTVVPILSTFKFLN